METTRPRKRNLVLFLPDQQRPDTIGCYGGIKVRSPSLAKLASESVVFERAYVTQPVCSPSRSSLITGLWPHTSGCTQNAAPINPKIRLLPELFEDKNYITAYMGKWHLRPVEMLGRAFSHHVSVQGASDYSDYLVSQGLTPDRKEGGFTELTISKLPVELSQPKFLERRACEFIRRNRDEAFVIVVAFVEPHAPYNGPLNDAHLLSDVEIDRSASIPLSQATPLRYRLIHEWQQEQALIDPEKRAFYFGTDVNEYRKLKQRYLGLVSLVDQSIGAILNCLNENDLLDRTVVVHTSDHGDMLGAHQLFGKEVMYEEAVRVPFLMKIPGQTPVRIAEPVSHINFVPTLLDLLGQPANEQCLGKSLLPRLDDRAARENVFVEWSPNWRAKVKKGTRLGRRRAVKRALAESTRTVITPEGWKLSLRDKDLNELYYLPDDPDELRNLFYEGSHRQLILRCTAELRRWQELTSDRCRLPKV